uniref:Uncharacterized protein n=1 Tax=Aegilops tauschii subsp. strangulata TaxID=200361 RepID=A0A453MFZ3_AEGTS
MSDRAVPGDWVHGFCLAHLVRPHATCVVFLSVVEGAFLASLEGGGVAGDELQLCVQSGDTSTCASFLLLGH